LRQIPFFDKIITPDFSHQLIFREQFAVMRNKGQQGFKNFRFERAGRPSRSSSRSEGRST
jgi:hypothetical protein